MIDFIGLTLTVKKPQFAPVGLEVDISKSLKMEVKYIRSDTLYECFFDYGNISSICYGCGSQSHNFDACSFNTKSLAFRVEKLQEPSQVDKSHSLRAGKKTLTSGNRLDRNST